ncbi:MAG: outer membrane protein assembly factor BamE [Serratia marcescens]|uniref:outer membrane protein assembly factor BamE domain-containing protein n=1 Tax=Serratia marcescens TaxID=615 RepID=UPI00290CA02B|nr:outer membrane protein assembly factor BamE [Serratia marcescens]
MRKILIVVLLALSATACTTGEKISDLSPGMSREQVISTLGRPDGDAISGKYELLTYSNRLMSGWSYDKADYKVILENGKVLQYGAETVRPDNGAAASRAISAQQSLLIWQQQQALQQQQRQPVYMPPVQLNKNVTTNCSQYGNRVTCNSY